MQESDVQWLHQRLVKVRGPLARMSLTDRERRVLDCVYVRMWELALPVVRLTEREIAAWTGIRQPHVHNALSGLKGRWVVWMPAPSVVGIVLNDATWLEGEDRGEEREPRRPLIADRPVIMCSGGSWSLDR